MIHLHGANEYSAEWEQESLSLESHGVYQALAKALPLGRVLEIGCGVGNGTVHIAEVREVLSLDNNAFLIAKAAARLKQAGHNVHIHRCDFYELTTQDVSVIEQFQPNVVAAWFIGSHGQDISRRTPDDVDMMARPKLYREGIEDVIVSNNIAVDSVDIINLVWRGGLAVSSTFEEVFDSQKADYDEYVFGPVGFEVYDVKLSYWDRTGSTFEYGRAHNPNFAGGPVAPIIISIFARRKVF